MCYTRDALVNMVAYRALFVVEEESKIWKKN